jgi:hypothetical protein
MAWKFLDDSKSSNKKYREEMMVLINSWWAHFQNKRKNIEAFLDGRAQMDLEDFMADSLQSIDENLMWEYGTEPGGGKYQLVITPETERHLRPLVETIVATAPKLNNWSFYAYRQPHGFEDTAELVQETTGISLDTLSFAATSDEEHLINLLFKYSGEKGPEAQSDAVFMTVEYLLGEEILDRWIGDMDFAEASSKAKFKPMSDLPNTVFEMIEAIKKKMPEKPLAALRDSFKIEQFKLEPEDDEDHSERFEMRAAHTRLPHIWQAAHSGSPFDSCRFSRHNEKFCYLKLEGLTDGAKLSALESSINEALAKTGSGCTIGTGHGNRFGYIDLALSDPAKAIAALKEICERECPQHSWLQFFDSDWTSEWIPMNSKSTTPPGMVER